MNLALLLFLALLWCVVLLPSAIRNHRGSLHHSMGGFARTMQVLGSSPGNAPRATPDLRRVMVPANAARIVAPPRGEDLARERRRKSLRGLVFAAALTTTIALLAGGVFWAFAAVADAALIAFVAALRNIAVRAKARRELVRLGDHRRVPVQYEREQRHAVVG